MATKKTNLKCEYEWVDTVRLKCKNHDHWKVLVDPWLREKTIAELIARGELKRVT